jgi:hypothetical protein
MSLGSIAIRGNSGARRSGLLGPVSN